MYVYVCVCAEVICNCYIQSQETVIADGASVGSAKGPYLRIEYSEFTFSLMLYLTWLGC